MRAIGHYACVLRRAALAILIVGCCACGASHASKSGPTATTGTPCSTFPTALAKLPSGSVPSQEQIKQLGQNGGGCYDAGPTTSTTP